MLFAIGGPPYRVKRIRLPPEKLEIDEAVLRSFWEATRRILARKGYRASKIGMPPIRAFVMRAPEHTSVFKASSHGNRRWRAGCERNMRREHKRIVPANEVAGFVTNAWPRGYVVFVNIDNTDRGYLCQSMDEVLLHELLHVWERKLKLRTGRLTSTIVVTLHDLWLSRAGSRVILHNGPPPARLRYYNCGWKLPSEPAAPSLLPAEEPAPGEDFSRSNPDFTNLKTSKQAKTDKTSSTSKTTLK